MSEKQDGPEHDAWAFYTGEPDPDAAERDRLTVLLRAYLEARTQRDAYAKVVESLGAQFKVFLVAHPEEVLWDGENQIEGRLQQRSGAPVYDLLSLREQDPVLFKRVLDLGCMDIVHKRVQEHQAQLPTIARYAMPRPGTMAIDVQRRKE